MFNNTKNKFRKPKAENMFSSNPLKDIGNVVGFGVANDGKDFVVTNSEMHNYRKGIVQFDTPYGDTFYAPCTMVDEDASGGTFIRIPKIENFNIKNGQVFPARVLSQDEINANPKLQKVIDSAPIFNMGEYDEDTIDYFIPSECKFNRRDAESDLEFKFTPTENDAYENEPRVSYSADDGFGYDPDFDCDVNNECCGCDDCKCGANDNQHINYYDGAPNPKNLIEDTNNNEKYIDPILVASRDVEADMDPDVRMAGDIMRNSNAILAAKLAEYHRKELSSLLEYLTQQRLDAIQTERDNTHKLLMYHLVDNHKNKK